MLVRLCVCHLEHDYIPQNFIQREMVFAQVNGFYESILHGQPNISGIF